MLEPPSVAVGMCGREPVTPASRVAMTAAGCSEKRSPSAAPVGCRLDHGERVAVEDGPEAGSRST